MTTCVLCDLFRPNGNKYEGEWHNGKQNGQGYLTKNGTRRLYMWENGKRVSQIDDADDGGNDGGNAAGGGGGG